MKVLWIHLFALGFIACSPTVSQEAYDKQTDELIRARNELNSQAKRLEKMQSADIYDEELASQTLNLTANIDIFFENHRSLKGHLKYCLGLMKDRERDEALELLKQDSAAKMICDLNKAYKDSLDYLAAFHHLSLQMQKELSVREPEDASRKELYDRVRRQILRIERTRSSRIHHLENEIEEGIAECNSILAEIQKEEKLAVENCEALNRFHIPLVTEPIE